MKPFFLKVGRGSSRAGVPRCAWLGGSFALPNCTTFGLLLALLLVLPTELLAAPSFYVSPEGDDANPGTKEKPVRSLERARDLVRSVNQDASDDITVYLAGGVFRLTQPLTLEARDSGPPSHKVIYTAAGTETPIVTGAVRVTSWKRIDAARNLWSAPPPASLKNTRQLYVDGIRARRTSGLVPFKLSKTETGYIADSDFKGWKNPAAVEFVYTGGNSLWTEHSEGLGAWTEPRCPIAAVDGSAIIMAQPCWDNSTRRIMLPRNTPGMDRARAVNLVGPASIGKTPVSVENAFELLGTPGQWYFDRPANIVYYVPRPGEDLATADVEAPVLEKLIVGEGTATQPIHNIIFKGLEFTGATWLAPSGSEGFSEIQANYCVTGSNGWAVQGLGHLTPNGTSPYGAWTKTPGNVSFSHDSGIQFLRCAFVHLGGAGLELGHGSQSDVVEGCVFTDISANGLELGGVDRPDATGGDITTDNRIVNNHIYDVAAEFHGGIGLCVGYARNTVIQHNQIDHLPYSGISMGWGGWPDKIKKAGVSNFSENNLVANNLIFEHMLLLADGAAIYTQGLTGPTLEAGEKIEGNVIHDQFGSGHGIYTDNGCKNVTARNNVIFRVNFDNWGGRHKDYYDGQTGANYDNFLFEGNYWQQGDVDSSKQNVTLRHNHLISALDQVPKTILLSAGLELDFRDILKRSFGKSAAPEAPNRVAASAGNGFVLLAWNPPPFEGSAPIDSYIVISSKGQTMTVSAADFRSNAFVKFSGLDNGAQYTFTVAGRNAVGLGAPSLPSLPVTCKAGAIKPPGAPQAVSAHYSDDMASIHFQAPEEDGGSPILADAITIEPGGRKVTFAGRAALTLSGTHKTFTVVDGLEQGKTWSLQIAAVNAAGEGAKTEVPPPRAE